jgi:hypothetical protein
MASGTAEGRLRTSISRGSVRVRSTASHVNIHLTRPDGITAPARDYQSKRPGERMALAWISQVLTSVSIG